jgi:hypothetical protein
MIVTSLTGLVYVAWLPPAPGNGDGAVRHKIVNAVAVAQAPCAHAGREKSAAIPSFWLTWGLELDLKIA